MEINGHQFEYDDDTHTYYVDGKKCISVTQLLHWKYPRKYANVPEEVLKEKAKKGTELHEAIEVYEEYGMEREDLLEFRNYKTLKKMFGWEVEAVEIPVIIQYKDTFVCGRYDQLQCVKGDHVLADVKHTATLDKEYLTYQLNLYRLGHQQCYGDEIKALYGIHLNNDKRKYVKLPINEEMTYQLLEDYFNAN